jgi:hypothetical protein
VREQPCGWAQTAGRRFTEIRGDKPCIRTTTKTAKPG